MMTEASAIRSLPPLLTLKFSRAMSRPVQLPLHNVGCAYNINQQRLHPRQHIWCKLRQSCKSCTIEAAKFNQPQHRGDQHFCSPVCTHEQTVPCCHSLVSLYGGLVACQSISSTLLVCLCCCAYCCCLLGPSLVQLGLVLQGGEGTKVKGRIWDVKKEAQQPRQALHGAGKQAYLAGAPGLYTTTFVRESTRQTVSHNTSLVCVPFAAACPKIQPLPHLPTVQPSRTALP